MTSPAAQNYLNTTKVESSEKYSRCTVFANDGEQLFTIKFNAIPYEAEIESSVDNMIKETGCIPKAFRDVIVRQVKNAVQFKMEIPELAFIGSGRTRVRRIR